MSKKKLRGNREPIDTMGGTNIFAVMEITEDIIHSINQVNDVSGIYLLSDGQVTTGMDSASVGSIVQKMLESKNIGKYSNKWCFKYSRDWLRG